MHILVIHPDPLFYREVLPLLTEYEATGAFARTLGAACDQLLAHPPQVIILGTAALQMVAEAQPFIASLEENVSEGLLFLTGSSVEGIRSGPERQRLENLLAYVADAPVRRRRRYHHVGNLRLDVSRQRATLTEEWVRLPRIQFRLLHHLIQHVGELVPYRELMKAGWGFDGETGEARELLKDHLRQMRRRLGSDFLPYLQIVRGEGYVLVNPLDEE
jgi:DNA-binding winged helix-turn-helix (wHTH) protein